MLGVMNHVPYPLYRESSMNNTSLQTPNFFIVGAPKCGTTSLYYYLRQHPDIFMPHDDARFWITKEPHYYASDLAMARKVRFGQQDQYLNLFQQASGQKRIGEASALYLYSPAAASQIKQLNGDIKIVIMLRPPIEMMQSWHRDCLRWGHEDIGDFKRAVEAEPERKQGKRIPTYSAYPSRLIYTEMGHYLQHVQRYLDLFGRDNVQIILLEDLHKDPDKVYRAQLEFLGVNSAFTVDEYKAYNKTDDLNTTHVSEQKLKLFLIHNARFIYTIFEKLTPTQQDFIRSMPKFIAPRKEAKATDSAFMLDLRASYASEIQQLGRLINRDLTHWNNTN